MAAVSIIFKWSCSVLVTAISWLAFGFWEWGMDTPFHSLTVLARNDTLYINATMLGLSKFRWNDIITVLPIFVKNDRDYCIFRM